MLRSYLAKDHPLKSLELGSEPTVQEFIANMVRVFGLVRETMADHAVCFVNVGDTYATGNSGGGSVFSNGRTDGRPTLASDESKVLAAREGKLRRKPAEGIESGNLCLIPQRLAIALQDDGWIVRSVIVWHKPAPMPASLSGWQWVKCRVKVKEGGRGGHANSNGIHTGRVSIGEIEQDGAIAQWSDCPGCEKCVPNGGLVLRRGSWRPTSSWEPILMLAKGSKRVSRVIEFPDLDGQRFHLGSYLRLHPHESLHLDLSAANDLDGFGKICILLAAAIFNQTQAKADFSLPPFNSEKWKESAQDDNGSLVAGSPTQQCPAVLAARLLSADISTKEFFQQLQRLGVTLSDGNKLRISDAQSEYSLPPGIFSDANGTIRINNAGEVCKLDFVHSRIVLESRVSVPYYADGETVKTPLADSSVQRQSYGYEHKWGHTIESANGIEKRDFEDAASYGPEHMPSGANPRDVQTWASEPLKLAHYAAFPTALVRFCLRAGTSLRGYCPTCGAPWARVVETTDDPKIKELQARRFADADESRNNPEMSKVNGNEYAALHKSVTLGWRPTCRCPEQEPRPALVLDPFSGSGRTGLTAIRMGLDYVGVELSPEYVEMSRKLLKQDAPLFSGGVE